LRPRYSPLRSKAAVNRTHQTLSAFANQQVLGIRLVYKAHFSVV
jgi:hypothetical protein